MITKAGEAGRKLTVKYWDIPSTLCIQRTSKGLIPHQVINKEKEETPTKCQATFSQGGLSQEIGLGHPSPFPTGQQMYVSGNFYHDTMAMAQILSGYASRDHRVRDEMTAIIRNAFKDAMQVAHCYFPMNPQTQSEYMDLFPESDNRKKDIRIRAAGEPKRQTKKSKTNANDEKSTEVQTFSLNM